MVKRALLYEEDFFCCKFKIRVQLEQNELQMKLVHWSYIKRNDSGCSLHRLEQVSIAYSEDSMLF